MTIVETCGFHATPPEVRCVEALGLDVPLQLEQLAEEVFE
jgi:hypothetical protein